MKKILRIIVSPVVIAFCLFCYWLAGPIGIMMILTGIEQWVTDKENWRDTIEMGCEVLLIPLIIAYQWIQEPEKLNI